MSLSGFVGTLSSKLAEIEKASVALDDTNNDIYRFLDAVKISK
jgi:hypothetical protein